MYKVSIKNFNLEFYQSMRNIGSDKCTFLAQRLASSWCQVGAQLTWKQCRLHFDHIDKELDDKAAVWTTGPGSKKLCSVCVQASDHCTLHHLMEAYRGLLKPQFIPREATQSTSQTLQVFNVPINQKNKYIPSCGYTFYQDSIS